MKNTKTYALMAGMCYAIYGLYNMITYIIGGYISALSVIFWIAMIGMAAGLFLKNEKVAVATAGVNALLKLYSLMSFFVFERLFDFIAYVLVVVLILLVLKKSAVVQEIWLIPGIMMLMNRLIYWILGEYFLYISYVWKSMLLSLIEITGLILIGLWVKYLISSKTEQPSTIALGDADRLKMYFELLRSGTISQEEFDAKKQQLLKL